MSETTPLGLLAVARGRTYSVVRAGADSFLTCKACMLSVVPFFDGRQMQWQVLVLSLSLSPCRLSGEVKAV